MTNKTSQKTRITTRQFVDLIQCKKLSTSEIYKLAHQAYPGNDLTRASIVTRLRNMVRSPNAEIEVVGQGNQARYTLIYASERFLVRAEINDLSSSQYTPSDKRLWHFTPVELQFCRVHKMFDQALASVQGRASA